VLLSFLTLFLQCFLELLNFLGQLHEVLVNWIRFLTAFLSGAEFGLLLSVFLEPMTIASAVRGICAPMPFTQVAMLLKADFLGNPGHRLGTRMFLPFLALVGSQLGRFRFAFL
jgi:hypothetical protein